MYKITKEIAKRLEPFLKEYIEFDKLAFKNGFITEEAAKQAIQELIRQDVFLPHELSKEILQECNVLIPTRCIKIL